MSKNIYWAANSAPILPCWDLHSFNLSSLNETPASLWPAVSKTTMLDHLPEHVSQSKNLCISSVQGDL